MYVRMYVCLLPYFGLKNFPGRGGVFTNISELVDLNVFCQMKAVDLVIQNQNLHSVMYFPLFFFNAMYCIECNL